MVGMFASTPRSLDRSACLAPCHHFRHGHTVSVCWRLLAIGHAPYRPRHPYLHSNYRMNINELVLIATRQSMRYRKYEEHHIGDLWRCSTSRWNTSCAATSRFMVQRRPPRQWQILTHRLQLSRRAPLDRCEQVNSARSSVLVGPGSSSASNDGEGAQGAVCRALLLPRATRCLFV